MRQNMAIESSAKVITGKQMPLGIYPWYEATTLIENIQKDSDKISKDSNNVIGQLGRRKIDDLKNFWD